MHPSPHLLVVDGSYAIHRAFHALSSSRLKSPEGRPVWALHGFCTSLAKLVAMYEPTQLLVALDAAGGCPSRRALLPEYKQGRSTPPSELSEQLTAMPLLLREAGIPTAMEVGWEADDVIASAATAASAAGGTCSIFTADRDVYQLIDDRTSVARLDGGAFGPRELVARYGIEPSQYLDLAAMRGEAADAIEGVAGVGEKTAVKLLSAFGSFAAAVAAPERLVEVVGARLAGRLLDSVEKVERNREVARLNRTLAVDLSACALPLDGDRLAAALRRAHLPSAASALVHACAPARTRS